MMTWNWWVALAPATYFLVTHTGPFVLLCDAQEAAWGWFSGELSMLGAWLAVGLPLELVRRLLPRKEDQPEATTPSPDPPARFPPGSLRSFVSERYHLPIVAAVCLCVSPFVLYEASSAGQLREVRAEDYESHAPPESSWVAVQGRVLVDHAVWDNKGSYFVPLVSASWQPGEPASVLVLAFNEGDVASLRSQTSVQGITRRWLSPEARRTLADGPAPAIEGPWVLRLNDTPLRILAAGRGILGVGLAATLAVLVWWRVEVRRSLGLELEAKR